MAEQATNIMGEGGERIDVRRNTSNQIISYTLPDDSEKKFGYVRMVGQRNTFDMSDFEKAVAQTPTILVYPNPPMGLSILTLPKLDMGLPEFIDIFSATYLIPTSLAGDQIYKAIRFPNGIADVTKNTLPGKFQHTPFTKAQSGPSQKTKGRYTITSELIETGRDLRMHWHLLGWNSEQRNVQNNSSLSRWRYDASNPVVTRFSVVSSLTSGTNAIPGNTGVYFYLTGEYIIRNADMVANDEWELQGSSGARNKQSIMTDRCWWKIEIVPPGTTVDEDLANSNAAEKRRIEFVEMARLAGIASAEESAAQAAADAAAGQQNAPPTYTPLTADEQAEIDSIYTYTPPSTAGFSSDIRLKENIKQIGESPWGIPIFQFNYIGNADIYSGVIAQNLIELGRNGAVIQGEDGFLLVNYDKIDVELKLIKRNS